jgi:hypothetical protein
MSTLLNARLEWVEQYVPPEPTHPLFGRNPHTGLSFSHPRTDSTALVGRTLRNQCQGLSAAGPRCTNCTTFDYRYCWKHLLKFFCLMIAPTTIPGLRGWGLFAVDPQRFVDLGLDSHRRPVTDPATVVWERGDIVGGEECYFVGEQLPEKPFAWRYNEGTCGDYVLQGVSERTMLDGLVARTVLQFSNDAVNVADPLMRRNYIDSRTQQPVMVMPDYPVVMNADGVAYGETTTVLIARGPITHGQEIFWSYAGSTRPSKSRTGNYVPTDTYWSALNHRPQQQKQKLSQA